MHRLWRLLKWLGFLILALPAGGAIYQQAGALFDDFTLPPAVGRTVAVGGYGVHFVCSGAGKRTFVLDAGLGAWSAEWYRLQPMLAKMGRVCAYDRPGFGGSAYRGHAFDGVTAADELHALLPAMGVAKPFVYVGHSLGANFGEIYAARFPKDLEALILIEPGVPKDLLSNFDPISRETALAMPATCGASCYAGWAAGALGVGRFIVHHVVTGAINLNDPATLARYQADASRSSAAATGAAYFAALPKTCFQDTDIANFGVLPILVLASAIAPQGDPGEDMAAWRRRQLAYFRALAAKSAHGAGPMTIAGSTHASMVMGSPAGQTAADIGAFLAGLAPR